MTTDPTPDPLGLPPIPTKDDGSTDWPAFAALLIRLAHPHTDEGDPPMTTDPTIVDEHVARAVELAGNCIGYDTAAQVHALAAIAYAIVDGTKSNTTLANDVSVVAEEALNLNDRLDAVDDRLDTLKDITQTHTTDVRVLGQRLDAVVNRTPGTDATLTQIDARIDRLTERYDADIAELTMRNDRLTERCDAYADAILSLTGRLADAVDRVDSRFTRNDERITDLHARVTDLNRQVNSIIDAVGE